MDMIFFHFQAFVQLTCEICFYSINRHSEDVCYSNVDQSTYVYIEKI